MQDRQQHQKLSRLRQELLEVLERLRKTLEVVLARSPLVKGSVYQIARRCGLLTAVALAANCIAISF